MKIEQIYTGCLAQGAYYIESEGEAAIIDPLREIGSYLKKAKEDGARIKYVFETHFHADFVSGHLDLVKATGAQLIYGPQANPSFKAHIGTDGEIFTLGKLQFKLLHTPGHTMESTCYLLLDEAGKEHAIFTGDTLFIGDVGRPDLAQKAANLTQEELAGTLFDSLRSKIMPLPDSVIVYPGHGAGSACGKNMSKETTDTLGNQKRSNYALRADMTREEFVREVTNGLQPPPAYFGLNVRMNKEGYDSFDEVLQRASQGLSADAFEAAANATEALVLDTRKPTDFAKGFIPNSIFIGLDGQFAPWVGALLPSNQALLLVTEPGREEETITRLARVGYDSTIGYLQGGFEAWKAAGKEIDTINSITAQTFADQVKQNNYPVIDVRKPGEYEAEHLEGALNIPLDFLNDHLAAFPRNKPFYVHCAGGYRSMIAASILKARGWELMTDVQGGYGAISKTDLPRTTFTCPSTK